MGKYRNVSIYYEVMYTLPVLEAFYRSELRDGEDRIDNEDPTIAKELGIPTWVVTKIIDDHLLDKRETLNRNNELNREKRCPTLEMFKDAFGIEWSLFEIRKNKICKQ